MGGGAFGEIEGARTQGTAEGTVIMKSATLLLPLCTDPATNSVTTT
jgi:hypothetical protein